MVKAFRIAMYLAYIPQIYHTAAECDINMEPERATTLFLRLSDGRPVRRSLNYRWAAVDVHKIKREIRWLMKWFMYYR